MRISDWSSDVCSSDLCPVLQRCADIDGPGIGMDAGIDECYRRPSEFDLTVIGHQANERSEEHTSELQSLMRISYAVFCLKRKKKNKGTQLIVMTIHLITHKIIHKHEQNHTGPDKAKPK